MPAPPGAADGEATGRPCRVFAAPPRAPRATGVQVSSDDAPWGTIPGMIAENFRGHHAHRCALVDGDRRFSYAALFDALRVVGARLEAAGVGAGSPVAIWAPNSWRWVVAALACWWRGAVPVPIPATAKMLEGRPLIERVDARALFVDESRQDGDIDWQRLFPGRALFSLRERGAGALEALTDTVSDRRATRAGSAPAAVAAEDTCELLLTSGSTGRPKAVIRQHRQVIRNRHGSSLRRGFRRDDVLLALAPFSHTLGLNGTLLRSLMLGAQLVIAREPSPRGIARAIVEEGITAISAPPSLFAMLLDLESPEEPLIRRLRLLSIGSDKLTEGLIARLRAAGAGAIACGYGMTECESISSATGAMGSRALSETVGTPEPGVQVRIVDAGGRVGGAGEAGEIQVRSYATTVGYFDDPDETAALYTADGWLKTGDIGRWNEDGLLQVLGRQKDVIIAHGYTLYPADIEQLMLHSNLLEAVAVFGIPNALGGESCVAAVVPRDPATFAVRELMAWSRRNMSSHKVPARVFAVDRIPCNSNGKVDRPQLRARCAALTHDR
mgnify:FL=1